MTREVGTKTSLNATPPPVEFEEDLHRYVRGELGDLERYTQAAWLVRVRGSSRVVRSKLRALRTAAIDKLPLCNSSVASQLPLSVPRILHSTFSIPWNSAIDPGESSVNLGFFW